MKLKSINIKRFRSINDLKLEIDTSNNFISICGPNNVGKTNVLRALNLFFNPSSYVFENDTPYLKQNTRGGSIATEINLQFEDKGFIYEITKKIQMKKGKLDITDVGLLYKEGTKKKEDKNILDSSKISELIKSFVFFYIPAINVSFPELINLIINDVYEIEFINSRFSGLKGELKTSFEKYNRGLVDVLNRLAEEINPLFQKFNENWSVEFKSNIEVKKFQDLISKDISFHIDDKAGFNNEGKGSGLQKLGFILLHQKIIEKLSRSKKKNIIFCIDEPDAFLHRGLQLRLKEILYDISNEYQVIVTTHSPEFIDSSTLKNVILLDQDIGGGKIYARTKSYMNPINTISIDLSKEDGAKKIREYLGLEEDKTDLLDNYNLFVEGDCDKKYISELCEFFKIETKRIFSINGVNKYDKTLDFYDDWYSDSTKKPKITLLFDNDDEGRKCYKLIKGKKFKNIQVDCKFIPTRTGGLPDLSNLQNVRSNLEIEDFIYPELIFYLSSLLLSRKNISKFSFKELDRKLKNKGFADGGILASMDLLLKDKNPNGIGALNFRTSNMKGGLASHFNLSGNKKITSLLIDADKKYPEVKKFLIDIMRKN